MLTTEGLAIATTVIAVALRLLCAPLVKRGASKYSDDAELREPLAKRWVGQGAVDFGVALSLLFMLVAGALWIYVWVA